MSTVKQEVSFEKPPANTPIAQSIVLLVDDQPMVAEGIRRMLMEESDISFHYCRDPREALQMAADLHATTILQDLVMPDIDGFTLVRFFRNNPATKDIPVIVLSSKEDPKIKSEAFGHGANDYLVKLPDKIELIARIRAHSRSFMLQVERDMAFKALRETQRQLEESNAELKRLSSLDGLTGIANRRRFDEYLDEEWRRAQRNNSFLAMILIDIDYFKTYNDNYGHQSGDDTLKQVAATLKNTVQRPGDLVARYGGEEFVVVLPSTDLAGTLVVAERLRATIEALQIPHVLSQCTNVITISLGAVSMRPPVNGVPADIISEADKALYAAKKGGRNRTEYSE
jgi:two-component system chemotaxis family response regulator WspR